MSRRERIETLLAGRFSLDHLEVVDESSGHNVPAGAESHFKVVLVSAEFADQARLARHRAVQMLVADEFSRGLHALAIHPYTPSEWEARFGQAPMSPPCAGGGRTTQQTAG